MARKRVKVFSSFTTLGQGLDLAEKFIKEANVCALQNEENDTNPTSNAWKIWRNFEDIALRLHTEFNYDFPFEFEYRGEKQLLANPLLIDFEKLAYSVENDDGEFFFHPFAASPVTHKDFPENGIDDSYAVDIHIPLGTKVIAVKTGKITNTQWNSKTHGSGEEFGDLDNRVFTKTSDLLTIAYRHLEFDPDPKLSTGKLLKEGEKVGEVGLTGWTDFKPHLHFAIYESKAENGLFYPRSIKLKFARI